MSTPYDLARDLERQLKVRNGMIDIEVTSWDSSGNDAEGEFDGFTVAGLDVVERAFKQAINDEIESCAVAADDSLAAARIRARRRP